MRVYLDNCCYNRPFDLQNQTRVQVETASKLAGCDWLLTTDDRFVKRASGNTAVRVASPVVFIMENRDEDV